jgi:hypothetical protein
MTTLQMIIKKAQALRKASPKKFSKWTDYVKAASATIKPKKKAAVGAVKKKAVKKAAPKKAAAKKAVKKVVKKAATKKATSIHKDSKSHNVKISVVSGVENIKKDIARKLESAIKLASTYKSNIEFEKLMSIKDKERKNYWNLKAKESKVKLDIARKMILKLKKAI